MEVLQKLAAQTNDPSYLLHLAWTYKERAQLYWGEQPKLSELDCRRAIEIYTEYLEAHSDLAGAWLCRGTIYLWLGDPGKAGADFSRAIELNPNHWGLRGDRCAVYLQLHEYEKAVADSSKGIEINGNVWSLWTQRGEAHLGLGLLDKAIIDYREASRLKPDIPQTFQRLGSLLERKGDWGEAIAAYRKAIELDPKYANAYHGLGLALLRQGKEDEAIDALRKAIKLDPKDAFAHNSVARAYALLGQWDQAAAHTGKQIPLRPSDNILWMAHASFLLRAGDSKGYRLACKEMIDKFGQTKNPFIAHRVAWTCYLMRDAVSDQKLLMELAERSVDGAPADPWTGMTLGLAFYRAGQFEKAVMKLQPYAEIGWCQIPVSLILAMAHQRLGHCDQARRLFDKGVKRMEMEIAAKVSGPVRNTDNAHAWAAYEILRDEAQELLKK
jgi:tetratricopeptide (TPR) repeat protein